MTSPATPAFETLRLSRQGAVATITLDRPQRLNAAPPQMFDELGLEAAVRATAGVSAAVLSRAVFHAVDDHRRGERLADDLTVLVPAFVVTELTEAFAIGFLIYLPFLVIDLVVSSVLMSLGMMMMSPTIVSLPFKLLLFVLVDGWRLVAGSLIESFNAGAPPGG